MKYKIPELPGPVSAHVQAKILGTNWEQQLKELRDLCDGCPAQGEPDICADCPLQGMAHAAATLTLKARLLRLQAKGTKKAKAQHIEQKSAKNTTSSSISTDWSDWETLINSGL